MIPYARNVIVQEKSRPGRHGDLRVEMCEHKGVGHPDTIADGACEAAARALAAAYQQACGRILHFNVDKGLLIAGQSAPRFGGGVVVEPARLIVCGRAADAGDKFALHALVVSAVDDFLQRSLRTDRHMFRVIPEVKPGSASLASIFASETRAPVANDTSFGVGFAPYSTLERRVLQLAAMLRSQAFRSRFPAAGDDVKVMGLRRGGEFRFTIAVAMIDRHVRGAAHYFAIKHEMTAAAAGKNPFSHVGKVYNALAHSLACEIVATVDVVDEAEVQLLSSIGQAMDRPQLALIEVGAAAGVTEALRKEIERIANHRFDRIADLMGDLARGAIPVY